jgi:hypothetical protein
LVRRPHAHRRDHLNCRAPAAAPSLIEAGSWVRRARWSWKSNRTVLNLTGGNRLEVSDGIGKGVTDPNVAFHQEIRTFGELLIDLEEDKAARGVVFGLLREMERK